MLRETLNGSMKDAMKAKDQVTLSTLRLVNAAIKQQDIDVRSSGNADGIADTDILSLLQKMIKQRRESIKMYEEGGRPDAAAQEAAEIEVIERFLPQMMSEAEVQAALEAVISETGAGSIKDMGPVMSMLKEKYAGQIDFGSVSPIVKQRLCALAKAA